MLFRLKLSIRNQLLLILGLCAISLCLSLIFDYEPRLRMNFSMMFKGLIGGAFCFIVVALLNLFALFIKPALIQKALSKDSEILSNISIFAVMGLGLTSGAGEELLFRAFIFSLCASSYLWLGLVINFLLMLVCYFRGRDYVLWTLIKAIECSVYALMYYYQRSLFFVAVCHLTNSISFVLILRNEKVNELLKGEQFSLDYLKEKLGKQ